MIVRKSTQNDLPQLMRIYREARGIQIASGNPNQWKAGYPSEELIRSDIDNGVNYIIEDNGRTVGAFTFIYGTDPTYAVIENGSWLDDSGDYATIHRLGSLKEAHGVAAACFSWCEDRCDNIRVDTHEDNSIMRHCIEKAGFTYCGVIHLLNGDPRLAFQKIKGSLI